MSDHTFPLTRRSLIGSGLLLTAVPLLPQHLLPPWHGEPGQRLARLRRSAAQGIPDKA